MRLRVLAAAVAILVHSDGEINYPIGCCGGHDCAPGIIDVFTIPATTANGVRAYSRITTKHGTALIPDSIVRRQSPDGRAHACLIAQDDGTFTIRCLWVPPEA